MNTYNFFKTSMPITRKADYYLGCLDGCVYLDFNNGRNGLIYITRISFDGYGCCNVGEKAKPMTNEDSVTFKKLYLNDQVNENEFVEAIQKTLLKNKELLWVDALQEYNLIIE